MDLLGENKKKNSKTTGQKVVLTLLIVSILLFAIIVITLIALQEQYKTVKYTITLDGNIISETDLGLRQTEDGTVYMSLRLLSNKVGYKYYNGEFKLAGEDKNKGYIDNGMCITQFFANSNEIYKTQENSTKDYEPYKLKNKILDIDNTLYISLDDLGVGLNLVNTYFEEKNQTSIQTVQYFIKQNTEKFKQNGLTISNGIENNRAIAYGYVIIDKEGKYGVVNLRGEEIIGAKYNNIVFCENTGDFIVSDANDKFGVITDSSKVKLTLQYDSIEVLNYSPILYKVEKLEKYGIAKEDGVILDTIQYEQIGYPENKQKEINYTLIIPKINENIPKSIVVCENKKYGLIDFETGRQIIECNLAGIYSVTKDEKDYYIVETENGGREFLEDYINSLNKITVNM